MTSSLEFAFIPSNGIKLNTAFAGPDNGELVILLHGFPEAWFGWESQIRSLAQAGFRAAAPDQRGYNLSDKPRGVDHYRMRVLVEDILGLADALGAERFYLAGHDFGAMVAWNLAIRCPTRVKRMVIANVPHPQVMQQYLRTNVSQMLKSWYALFFQLPWLPEKVVRLGSWRMLIRAMPAGLSAANRERYRTAWAQPGAMTAMINWYRAALQKGERSGFSPIIDVPTLVVWGQQDPHLSYAMAVESLDYCRDGHLVTFEDATHWVQHDKAEEVSRLIVEHFSI